MIEEEKIDSIGNGKQPAGRRNVLLAWICPPRRVSMRNEEAATADRFLRIGRTNARSVRPAGYGGMR